MKDFYENFPESPGVYLMKDKVGRTIYVGKAVNLRRRVASYFSKAHDARIEKLTSRIKKVDYKQTDSALEALILEAKLIKQRQPPFNVREKDDKSFLYFEITKEKFSRVLLVRGKDYPKGERYGPFTSASSVRQAMPILRKIFPWNTHPSEQISNGKLQTASRPCFNYEIGLCPGTCIGAVSRKNYMKNIRRLRMFFKGKKKKIITELEREMKLASKKLDFESAVKLRKQIFALQHIHDTAIVFEYQSKSSNLKLPMPRGRDSDRSVGAKNYRVEGYDISNISGTSAAGSMVVFSARGACPSEARRRRGSSFGEVVFGPEKGEYRKFKIRTIKQSDDVGMLREVLTRRFRNRPLLRSWPLPDLILIDGGKGQVGAAYEVLNNYGLIIPIVGIAKGPKRKKNEFIGKVPLWTDEGTLIKVRDEAHRFAIAYHKSLRARNFIAR